MNYDMIFIHAPAIYDFRNRDDILFAYLSNSDSVHVSPVFEMPPIGMIAICQYLQKEGYKAEFFNIASGMLHDPEFNVEEFLKTISSSFVGIDLHWLTHAHGSLEIAGIYKKYHPDSKTIFGGITSTYFHDELIQYPAVDYVVRGYDTLKPVEMIVKARNNSQELLKIPNLTWKSRESEIRQNPLSHIPENYSAVINWKDIFSPCCETITPYNIVIPYAGCEYNCKICGGSSYFFKRYMGSDKIIKKKPEVFKQEMQSIVDSGTNNHIVTMINFWHSYNDLSGVTEEAFHGTNIKYVHISLHSLPDINRFRSRIRSIKAVVELSPDTHDNTIGKAIGRGKYTMDEMEAFFDALIDDVFIFEVYFMIGIPFQSMTSVRETVDYCDYLLNKYKGKKVIPYICPMLPFLDPGSEVSDNPEAFKVTIFHRTLEEHRQALLSMNWKNRLNYETDRMSRKELVDISYEAVKKLTLLKHTYGLLPKGITEDITQLIDSTCEIMKHIDTYEKMPEGDRKSLYEQELKKKIFEYNRKQFSMIRSQQRPLDFKFAARQWFDTDEGIQKIMNPVIMKMT